MLVALHANPVRYFRSHAMMIQRMPVGTRQNDAGIGGLFDQPTGTFGTEENITYTLYSVRM